METKTLNNERQATVAQVNAFIQLIANHGQRIKTAAMVNGFMIVNYCTKSGYCIQCTYNQYGQEIKKQHFKNWDAVNNEPVNPINFKE